MNRTEPGGERGGAARRGGFTLIEVLTVIGLIALLVALLMPVAAKVKSAARNAGCSANLKQMSVAWSMYVMENGGRLPDYMFQSRARGKNTAWYGYWPGILAKNGVVDELLRCPAARDEAPSAASAGFGNVSHAWSGRHSAAPNGSGVKLDAKNYRVSSYGHNRYLTIDPLARNVSMDSLNVVRDRATTPVFFDSAAPDARPVSRGEKVPEQSPPDLRGAGLTEASPQHWRFLLSRHGRGINVVMADGHVEWVRLEDTYLLTWHNAWSPYRLRLPAD